LIVHPSTSFSDPNLQPVASTSEVEKVTKNNSTQGVETVESVDHLDPVDCVDHLDHLESMESVESMERVESVESIESMESVESGSPQFGQIRESRDEQGGKEKTNGEGSPSEPVRSAYEQQREENIKSNRALLQELGLTTSRGANAELVTGSELVLASTPPVREDRTSSPAQSGPL